MVGQRDEDKYGRKLRVVTREGRSIGAVLVQEGLARQWGDGRRNRCDCSITTVNRSGEIDSGKSLDGLSVARETPPMSNTQTGPLRLRRVDPVLNMRRFYTLSIQPTLFGGASLVRDWGRIGTSGQSMMETFDLPELANNALARLERSKRRRGYCDAAPARNRPGPGNK